MLFESARPFIKKYGLEKIIDSWGHMPPTTLTLFNYPDFLTRVTVPGEHQEQFPWSCMRPALTM